jgi:hypothetical protein
VVEDRGGGGDSELTDLGAKRRKKRKTKGKGPRYRDRTIFGHDLPHTEVRDGRAALNRAEKGSDGFKRGRLGSSLEGSGFVSLSRAYRL